MIPGCLWTKILKKPRASAVLNSAIHPTSKMESGSHVVNCSMARHPYVLARYAKHFMDPQEFLKEFAKQ